MKKIILAAILGILIVILFDHPLLAQTKYPPPIFQQPDDTLTVQPVEVSTVDLLKCAQDCLTNKFPLDMFSLGDGSLDGIESLNGCPRMEFFKNSPGSVEFEACLVLDILSILKYPIVISFAVRAIYNL